MTDRNISQVAAGRHVLQIGGSCGAVVREVPSRDASQSRPCATPVLLRPKLMRGLVGRETDLAEAISAIDAALPVEVNGERGIGKTAILRQLAHHPRAESFADGVLYFSARHQALIDLQQLLFDTFFTSDGSRKPTEAEVRRALQEKHALILIDDVHLAQDELEQLFDTAPRCAFVVATRARRLWGEVHGLTLKGLPLADAVLLLEREIERPIDVVERSAAERLCAAIGQSPLRIRQAATLIREHMVPFDEWDRILMPGLVVNLMASIDDKQRRALLALASVPGVPLSALHISGIAEVIDIEPSLTSLLRRGLVVRNQSRYRLADGVTDRLRRTDDLKPWASRVITYFSGWAERHARKQDVLLQESEALLRVQQDAADARRSGEVLHLGRLLDGPLAAGGRWGAWGMALERCVDAARAVSDRPAEGWALHQLGSRALCLGDAGTARALLSQAIKLREKLNDEAGAAVSRGNLALVQPPVVENVPPPAIVESRPPAAAAPGVAFDLGSVPLRDIRPPSLTGSTTHSTSAFLIAMLLFAAFAGLAYWTYTARSSPFVQTTLQRAREHIATMRTPARPEPVAVTSTEETIALASDPPAAPPEFQPAPSERANILIFTPRPGSVTSGGPTNLCYAVSEALQARLEPDVGIVSPSRTLTCVRVRPSRTTTYELTAYGRDGYQVRQQLVIVVR